MYRNPAKLLALDEEPAVRLLRACGTDEAVIRNGSDYDRFSALAAAAPLCAGHVRVTAMQKELQRAVGLSLPLCPASAPLYWRAWTDIHWYEREFSQELPPCADEAPPSPTVPEVADVLCLPDPVKLATQAPALSAWTEALRHACPASGQYMLISLPTDFAFRRPDPYHAALAVHNVGQGNFHSEESMLLLSQALRILGETARARGVTLLLRGGGPCALSALFDYLRDCGRLPATVWLPDNPSDAAHVSGVYAAVGTGYVVLFGEPEAVWKQRRAAYAAVAPIGCAVELHM